MPDGIGLSYGKPVERLVRDHPGVTRTQTQIVLSTLFERPFEEPPPP